MTTRARPKKSSASRATPPDCGSAFQAIGLECVAAIKAHHGDACAGDVEAVHQIRIAITRLRAAVGFFKPLVADAEWLRLKKGIAWLNGPLGAARDSDVMLEHVRRKRYRAWAERMIGDRLEQQGITDRRRLVRALRSARARRLMAAIARWLKRGAWLKRFKRDGEADTLRSYCVRRLEHWHKRLVRKGRHLLQLKATARHALRIRAKRLRYVLESLKKTRALSQRRDLEALHRPAKQLQRALGDLRDLERLAGLVDRGQSGRHPPGYREHTGKLLDDADAARRALKRAAAC